MSPPRPVEINQTYVLSRRCSEGRLFLRPSPDTNGIMLYCLAEAANRFDIYVHALSVLDDSYIAVVTDLGGDYPAFLARFHGNVARALNKELGRSGALWAPNEQTSMVVSDDVFSDIVDTVCAPVEAGLVAEAAVWPGVTSLHKSFSGRPMTVRRPSYFSAKGKMLERVELFIDNEWNVEQMDVPYDEWAKRLRHAVAEKEADLAMNRRLFGGKILGRRNVLAQNPLASVADQDNERIPSPQEPTHFAARTGRKRLAARLAKRRRQTQRRQQAFVEAYREALATFQAGNPNVDFPYGTYQLHRLGLVQGKPPWRP